MSPQDGTVFVSSFFRDLPNTNEKGILKCFWRDLKGICKNEKSSHCCICSRNISCKRQQTTNIIKHLQTPCECHLLTALNRCYALLNNWICFLCIWTGTSAAAFLTIYSFYFVLIPTALFILFEQMITIIHNFQNNSKHNFSHFITLFGCV